MINWKEKLTSRKFWVAVSTILVGIITIFGKDEIAGTIIMICSTVAYVMGEAMVDANKDTRKEQENV